MRCDDLAKTKPNFQFHAPNMFSTEISMLFFEISDYLPIYLNPVASTTSIPSTRNHKSTNSAPPASVSASGKGKFDFSSLSSFPSYQRKRPPSSFSPSFSEPSGRRKKRAKDSISVTSGVTVNLVPIVSRSKKLSKGAAVLKNSRSDSKPTPPKSLALHSPIKVPSQKSIEKGLSEEDITRIIDPTLQNNSTDDYDIMRALNDDVLSGFLTES